MGVTDIQICLTSLEGEELLNIVEKAELENANHDRNIKQLNHSLPNGTAGGTDGPALALPTRDGEGMHLLQGVTVDLINLRVIVIQWRPSPPRLHLRSGPTGPRAFLQPAVGLYDIKDPLGHQ